MATAWFESVAEAQRPGAQAAAQVRLRRAAGWLGTRPDAGGQRRGLHRARLRAARRRACRAARPGHHRARPAGLAAGDHLADRRAGSAPRRRGRGSARRGCPRHRDGLSSFASKPVEEVVAANPQTFFQIYWCGSRDQILARMERARAAGAVGLILTLDWTFSHSRDWGSPQIPERLDLRTMLQHAPETLRPAALAGRLCPDRQAA